MAKKKPASSGKTEIVKKATAVFKKKDKIQSPEIKKQPQKIIPQIKKIRKFSYPFSKNDSSTQIQESKFYTGVQPAAAEAVDTETPPYELNEVPAGYGDNLIVLQVRDPYWAHAYWEISQEKRTEIEKKYFLSLDLARCALRVYDVTGVRFNGTNANFYFDVEINNVADNWYINLNKPGHSFCVDLGIFTASGDFVVIARSNVINTPLDGPSNIVDEEWMVVEEDFNKLYGMAQGIGMGLSSAELRELVKERMKLEISSGAVSSGAVSSGGISGLKRKRKFRLIADTELIVYGATEPDAKLTVQDKPIKLNPDGTFSLRFALPDGKQIIPIKAASSDGLEEREIVFTVERNKKELR
ncbi:MAG: DUF4912 domain-containing protein [Candidatus Omnitrophota bacterium]